MSREHTRESTSTPLAELGDKERLKKRKEEIFERVKDGSDQEGAFIHGIARNALEETSESLGGDAELYSDLKELKEKIEKPGAANEAIEKLKLFYAQTGIEPRQTTVEVDSGTSKEERLDLVRNRIKEHIDELPEAYADHRIMAYCEARAEVDDTRETLHQMIDEGDFGRDGFRREGYKLARQENYLRLVSRDLMFDSDASPIQRVDYDDHRAKRLSDTEADLEKIKKEEQGENYSENSQLESLGEEEVARRISKAEQTYKDGLSESGDEELVRGFETSEKGVRDEAIKNLAQHDYLEEHAVNRLESAINSGDAGRISELVNIINRNRQERFGEESGLNISTWQSRTERVVGAWDDFRNEIAIKIADSEDPTGVISGTGQVVRGSASVLTSRFSSGVARPVQENLRRIGQEVGERAGSAQDLARNTLNRVDHTLGDAARESGRLARDGIKKIGREAKAKIVGEDANAEIWRNRRTVSTADRIFSRVRLGTRRTISAIRLGATETVALRIATAEIVEEEVRLRMGEQREAAEQDIEIRREQTRSDSYEKLDSLLLERVVVEKEDETFQEEESKSEEKFRGVEISAGKAEAPPQDAVIENGSFSEKQERVAPSEIDKKFDRLVVPETFTTDTKELESIKGEEVAIAHGEAESVVDGKVYKYEFSLATTKGSREGENEDISSVREVILPDRTKIIEVGVRDGVGGQVAGAEASETADNAGANYLRTLTTDELSAIKIEAQDMGVDYGEFLVKRMVEQEHQAILDYRERNNDILTGATASGGIIIGDRFYVANVGDARTAEYKKDGNLSQRTKDHSLVQSLVDIGRITEDDAIDHPRSNVVLRSLGSGVEPGGGESDIYSWEVKKDHAYAVHCDGINGGIDKRRLNGEEGMEIGKIINDGSLAKASLRLVETAAPASSDNDTAIVFRLVSKEDTKTTQKRLAIEKEDEIPSTAELEVTASVQEEQLGAEREKRSKENLETSEIIEINKTPGEVKESSEFSKVVHATYTYWGTDWSRHVEYEKDGEKRSEHLQKEFSDDVELLYFARDGKLYSTSAKKGEDEIISHASLVGDIEESDDVDELITQDIERNSRLELKKEPVAIKEKELVRIYNPEIEGGVRYLFTWDEEGNVRGDPLDKDGNPIKGPISFRAEGKIEDPEEWEAIREAQVEAMKHEGGEWEVERNLLTEEREAQGEPEITIDKEVVDADWLPLTEEDQKRAKELEEKRRREKPEGIQEKESEPEIVEYQLTDDKGNTFTYRFSVREVDDKKILTGRAIGPESKRLDRLYFFGKVLDKKDTWQRVVNKHLDDLKTEKGVKNKRIEKKLTDAAGVVGGEKEKEDKEITVELEEKLSEEEQTLVDDIETAKSEAEISLEGINSAKGNYSPTRIYDRSFKGEVARFEEGLRKYNNFMTEKHPPQEHADADTLEAQYALWEHESMALYSDLKKIEDEAERFRLLKQYEEVLKQKIKAYRQLTK